MLQVHLFARVVPPGDTDKESRWGHAYPNSAFAGKVLDVLAAQDKKGYVIDVNAADLNRSD